MAMFDSPVGISGKNSFFSLFRTGYNPRSIWSLKNACCVPADITTCCNDQEKKSGLVTIFGIKDIFGNHPFDTDKSF